MPQLSGNEPILGLNKQCPALSYIFLVHHYIAPCAPLKLCRYYKTKLTTKYITKHGLRASFKDIDNTNQSLANQLSNSFFVVVAPFCLFASLVLCHF